MSRRSDVRDWTLSRRAFVRAGAISPLGLSLAGQLASERVAEAKTRKRVNCIFVWLQGGPSHIDMYDLKPDAPSEIRGVLQPTQTNVPGTMLGELLPHMASCADKFSIVRSMYCYSNAHGQSDLNLMSGAIPTRDFRPPGFGAVLSWQQKGGLHTQVPPFVQIGDITDPNFGPPGRGGELGRNYDPFIIDESNSGNFTTDVFESPESIGAERLSDRHRLLNRLDGFQSQLEQPLRLAATQDQFREQAFSIVTSRKAKAAFDLTRESEATRDDYGRNKIGQGLLLARRLIEAGVRFVTVRCVVAYAWDHHADIFTRLGHEVPRYDQGYAALLKDLHARGLLDDTLVVTAGEFGRTPRLNSDPAGAGRDHWNRAFSLTMGGGGIKKGVVVGRTDKHAAEVADRPVSVADFAATVYQVLSMNPDQMYYTTAGRPLPALASGTAIQELLS